MEIIRDFLIETYVGLLEVLIFLLLICISIVFLLKNRKKEELRKIEGLKNELTQQELKNTEEFKNELSQIKPRVNELEADLELVLEANAYLLDIVNHRLPRVLSNIQEKGAEIANELTSAQINLRVKQQSIIASCYEMERHARNTLQIISTKQTLNPRELSKTPINLKGLIEHILTQELYHYAKAKNVEPRIGNLAELEPIMANREFVKDILINVIQNAIKFSHQNSVVEITLNLQEGNNGFRAASITVRDWGRGISSNEKEAIFQLQARGSSQNEPGSGLGLYQARKLARLHNGDVILKESILGEGAIFEIVLPYT